MGVLSPPWVAHRNFAQMSWLGSRRSSMRVSVARRSPATLASTHRRSSTGNAGERSMGPGPFIRSSSRSPGLRCLRFGPPRRASSVESRSRSVPGSLTDTPGVLPASAATGRPSVSVRSAVARSSPRLRPPGPGAGLALKPGVVGASPAGARQPCEPGCKARRSVRHAAPARPTPIVSDRVTSSSGAAVSPRSGVRPTRSATSAGGSSRSAARGRSSRRSRK